MGYWDYFDLNTTAKAIRISIASDGMGGVTRTSSTYSTFSCAFWQQSVGETFVNGKITNLSGHFIAMQPSTAFAKDDIIKIGSNRYRVSEPDNILQRDELEVIRLDISK